MIGTFIRRTALIGTLVSLAVSAASGALAQDAKAPDYEAIVAAPDRTDGDR